MVWYAPSKASQATKYIDISSLYVKDIFFLIMVHWLEICCSIIDRGFCVDRSHTFFQQCYRLGAYSWLETLFFYLSSWRLSPALTGCVSATSSFSEGISQIWLGTYSINHPPTPRLQMSLLQWPVMRVSDDCVRELNAEATVESYSNRYCSEPRRRSVRVCNA